MHEGPNIARVSALIADPARSAILMALMDGRALTASELARHGGVTRQTASSHLARLVDGEVLSVVPQGRYRYFQLAGPHVASLLEALMVFSGDAPASIRTGPRDQALRQSRICYDHLAGARGVQLFDTMLANGCLTDDLTLTPHGWTRLDSIGVTPDTVAAGTRALCRACLDWSERRHHLAGRVGKAVLDAILARGWARRLPASRVIRFDADGARRFADWIA